MTAIKKKERIGIWGDFDVDGQTSTAVLVDGLRSLERMLFFIFRFVPNESHGIQLESLQLFLRKINPSLIITCDTGITEFESLDYLAAIGIDVILTDHHTPADKLPPAFATINPRLLSCGSSSSFPCWCRHSFSTHSSAIQPAKKEVRCRCLS